MSRTWLTVDTDDAHHRPWRQGHPTRSKDPDGRRTPRQPSEGWLKAIARFGDWVERSGHAVTVFVIQDQLEQPDARKALLDLAARGGPRLTFASHGTSHRAWGAWPEDAAGLTARSSTPLPPTRGLRQAGSSLVSGSFGLRCAMDGRGLGPSGRDGRFLGQPLTLGAQESRSDAPVVGRDRCHGSRRGAGATMARPSRLAGLWPCPAPARSGRTSATSVAQPPPVLMAEEVEGAVEGRDDLTTVYWHVVDHVRRKGRWEPPLKST